MKRVMVVFDTSPTAMQNLRVALEFIKIEKEKTENEVKLLICIPELLREDKPLDDYLGEMENATRRACDLAQQVLDEAGLTEIRPEILRETTSKAAQSVAHRAAEWQADQLFINLAKLCSECTDSLSKRPRFFSRHRTPVFATAQSGHCQPLLNTDMLLKLVNCRVTFTCHHQEIMSVRVYPPHTAKLPSKPHF